MALTGYKAIRKGALPVLLAAGLAAGCSPYPDEGTINTQIITDRAKLVDARGDVYGLQPGVMEKVGKFTNDASALYTYPNSAFRAHIAGEALPELELIYPSVANAPEMGNFTTLVIEDIEAQLAATKGEVEADIAERKKEMAQLNAKKSDVEAEGAEFEAFVAAEKAAFEKAQKAFEAAESRAENAFSEGLTSINNALIGVALDPFSEQLNPLKKYRYIDFAEKEAATPGACPDQGQSYTIVDARDELDTCFYVSLNDTYRAKSDVIVKVTQPALVEYVRANEALGKKGGWNRDGTGAHLVLAKAEKSYKTAVSNARDKFGDNDQRQRAIAYLNEQIADLQEDVDTYTADGFVESEVLGYSSSFQPSDDIAEIHNDYLAAVRADIASDIEKATRVQFDKESEGAVFSNLSGDYEGIIVLAELVGEREGRRDVASALEYLDLRTPEAKDADTLTVDLDRDSFRDGERMDLADPKAILNKLVLLLADESQNDS